MKRIDFNQNWMVSGENGQTRNVNLPDDAMLYEKRDKNSPVGGSGGYFMPGKYTYSKLWNVPAEYEGKSVILECEGVYQNSHVLLNGEELCYRPYGYTNYFVDLTGRLVCGQENEITIIADNSQAPNSRWYSGSGIYREVALYVGEKCSVAPEGIRVRTLDKERISVKVELLDPAVLGKEEELEDLTAMDSGTETTETTAAGTDDVRVEIQILDDGNIVAEGSGTDCEITVPDAVNWCEQNPKLYQCKVTVLQDGEIVDSAVETFGIRTVSWNGRGLFINDEKVLLRGACIHHDNGVLGACNFADAEYRRVKLLKKAGFNAIRSAHNPMSKAMLRACDELGIYVMDETFDMWFIQKNPHDYGGDTFRHWWKTDTAQMVSKDYSHPCVILYSIGNEISDLGTEEGQEMCREMSDFIRNLDPSRAITLGCNLMLASLTARGKGIYGEGKNTGSQSMDSAPTSELFNVLMNKMGVAMELMSKGKAADRIVAKTSCYLDIPGYNYAGMRYVSEANQYPDRAFVGSETLPQRLWNNWEQVKAIPQLVGDFMWTGWDYLGEAGIGTIKYVDRKTKKPAEEGLIISGGPGVIDITGSARPEVQWNKIIWGLSDKPEISVEPMNMAKYRAGASMWRDTDGVASWSWDGCEGMRNRVTVYAAGDKVRLSVNGKVTGVQKIRKNKAVFENVLYKPGKIRASVLDKDGNIIASKKLVSAEGKTALRIRADRKQMSANGQDLCFLSIDLVGENKIRKANDDRKITVSVDGPVTLQGFGSARPCMSEDFISDTHTTYRGHALAVVRAGYEKGEAVITFTGDGLEEKKILLELV